jgi:hypothetical protein
MVNNARKLGFMVVAVAKVMVHTVYAMEQKHLITDMVSIQRNA